VTRANLEPYHSFNPISSTFFAPPCNVQSSRSRPSFKSKGAEVDAADATKAPNPATLSDYQKLPNAMPKEILIDIQLFEY
jgi:hypothetical protein